MSYDPHRIPPPKIPDLIDEIRINSGATAELVKFNEKERKIYARGDYADLCLLRAEAKKHEWRVEPIL